MRTSYSSLDTYKTCPLKYKYQDIDKIRAPKSVEAVFGSSVHAALKFMFQRGPLFPTLDQVIDFFRDSWDQRKLTLENSSEESNNAYYKEGAVILEKFYKKNQPWNFNIIDLESRFETEIEDKEKGENHILSGIIDRIDKNSDDTFEIIDYKTGKKMPGQKDVDNSLQLSVYHLGLIRRWPHLDPAKIKLSFYFLKHGEKISTSRTSQQLEDTKKLVLASIAEIQEKIKDNYNFPPTPSALCDWCAYRQICPMWRHLYAKEHEKDKIKNQDELNTAVSEYFKLKNENGKNNDRLDELKLLVYSFMDDQKVDRVFGDEGYLTRRISERNSYDLEKIKEILEPAGKWQEILEPDEKKLETLLPHLPENLKQKIVALRTKKKIVTLNVKKKINTEDEGEVLAQA